MSEPLHFTFAGTPLRAQAAHAGAGEVLAARVLAHAHGGGARFVDMVVIPPGCSVGRHTHGDDEEIYVLVDGTGVMHVDGATFPVGPGDVVVNRPGGTHGLEATGELPLRLVVVDVAAGR